MTTTEIEFRELPPDVQDILQNRAIREHRPMTDIIREYVLESARLIIAAASTAPEKGSA